MVLYSTILNDDKHCELIKEKEFSYKPRVTNSDSIEEILREVFRADRMTEEHIWLFCLNQSGNITGVFELSVGSATFALFNNREIFQKALLANATRIIIAHNHPSGAVTPSKEDKNACGKIVAAGKIMGINLIDFCIIGDDFFSFNANCLL